jgi:toxin-antitoxin system PIN domain toxin
MNPIPPFLPDANVWINALNSTAHDHTACRGWLDRVTSDGGVLFVNDLTECALLRIATHPRLGIATPEAAMHFHATLLDYPFAVRATPGERHREILHRFIRDLALSGNDINDAWLAALAVERGAILASLDEGFSRFPGLSWINPALDPTSNRGT